MKKPTCECGACRTCQMRAVSQRFYARHLKAPEGYRWKRHQCECGECKPCRKRARAVRYTRKHRDEVNERNAAYRERLGASDQELDKRALKNWPAEWGAR